LPNKIAYLTKKSNILQLQTTVSSEIKNIQSELYKKQFNASHVSFLFKKHNSIDT